MRMVSYSQNAEDVRLARAFEHVSNGFFVDVGAAHPVFHSVTKHFSERGWRGVNVEPGTSFFSAIEADRPNDVNLNIGISNKEGTLAFHETVDSLGMSSFSDDFVAGLLRSGHNCVPRTVRVCTLKRVCEDHVGDRTIDFMKIDVEGHEREVIEGADWDRWRPRALVIEATRPETWDPLLLAARYTYVSFDGLNRYYVREEDESLAERLALPPNVLDEFETHHHLCQMAEVRAERDALARRVVELEAAAHASPRRHRSAVAAAWRRLKRLSRAG